jgi:hypothetical protein
MKWRAYARAAAAVVVMLLSVSCGVADLMFDADGNLLDDGLAGKSGDQLNKFETSADNCFGIQFAFCIPFILYR